MSIHLPDIESLPDADDDPDADPLAFTPVATGSTRHDGWTAQRQRQFVVALSVMGVVGRAARAVGMGAASAYRLRGRPGADEFAAAWDTALAQGRDRAWDVAMDRAVNGIAVPRFYRGRQVATVHRLDNRMILAALAPPRAPTPRSPGRKRA
ncbi:MAG: hypothetical protein ACRYFW_14050 [Janthinobacterium lividum]